jgi:adenylylsulfate kinase
MIYWITGKSSAGKTVYSKRLKRQFEDLGAKVLLLDGDTVRDQFENNDYGDESRLNHIMTIAKFAAIAEQQGFVVIIALISPKKEWRMKARKLFDKSMLIYLPGGILWEGTEYEEPDHEEMMVEG